MLRIATGGRWCTVPGSSSVLSWYRVSLPRQFHFRCLVLLHFRFSASHAPLSLSPFGCSQSTFVSSRRIDFCSACPSACTHPLAAPPPRRRDTSTASLSLFPSRTSSFRPTCDEEGVFRFAIATREVVGPFVPPWVSRHLEDPPEMSNLIEIFSGSRYRSDRPRGKEGSGFPRFSIRGGPGGRNEAPCDVARRGSRANPLLI